MSIGILFLIGCALLIIALLLLAFTNKWLPEWACSKLGWHLAPSVQSFDGCSAGGKCPRCGKDVLLDSQGNWF